VDPLASHRTLREIAAVQPRTVEELMRVYGIGATKATRHGRGFLEVVARAVSPPA
jgi:superfamily II DNA helicase RecQ